MEKYLLPVTPDDIKNAKTAEDIMELLIQVEREIEFKPSVLLTPITAHFAGAAERVQFLDDTDKLLNRLLLKIAEYKTLISLGAYQLGILEALRAVEIAKGNFSQKE